MGGPKKGRLVDFRPLSCLSTESVEGASLTFKSVDDVQSSDSLSLGVFSVSDSVSDDVFKENL